MFKTIAYADIFDYPLTETELRRWQIGGDKQAEPVIKTKGYFHLPGRANLIKLRRHRHHFSQLKWPLARRAAKILSLIPTVRLVCVTGALAMNNSDKDDDIDLLIVTQTNRLWLTRLLSFIFLFPYLRRRRRISNRLCLNLWLDETTLAIKLQNLYIAHEVCQARPVFDRDNTYQKFIAANLWYKQFLPNWKI